MANNVYIGMRYVPKLIGEWDDTLQTAYESLSIVVHNNNTFTSRRDVPVGIPLSNTDYWVMTGNFNGAIQYLQEQIDELSNDMSDVKGDILTIDGTITAIQQAIADIQQAISDVSSYEKDYFQNKSFLIIGDSICDPTTQAPNWVTHFKTLVESYGGTVNHSLCINGASFQSMYDDHLSDINALTNTYDVIIIALGLNDYHMQFGLKDCTSTTVHISDASMNGVDSLAAENVILATLRQRCPKALQYYCPPTRTKHTPQVTINTPISFYRNSFSRCAMYYGCRIIDLSAMPMFAPATVGNLNGYTTNADTVHPSNVYSPIMCDFVKRQLIAGGSSDWKDSGNKSGKAIVNIGQGYMSFKSTSHGHFRMSGAFTIDLQLGAATVLENLPFWFPEFPIVCFINDTPTRAQKIGTDLVVFLPTGVSAGTSLYIDFDTDLDLGVDYTNALD